jgi:hypothetical protein
MFVSLAKTLKKAKDKVCEKIIICLSIDHMKPIIIEPKEKKLKNSK